MWYPQCEELIALARQYANRPDIVQAGGGNMSVKIDEHLMVVKASGSAFRDVSQERGLVAIDHGSLKKYLLRRDAVLRSEEKHLGKMTRCVRGDMLGGSDARPSMEVWFHTLLKKYVLHTHSVYVNILGCTEEGSELFARLLAAVGIPVLTLPYVNPGVALGIAMVGRLADYGQAGQDVPGVLLLQNHGIIVTSDTYEDCIRLHDFIETEIKKLLAIHDPYPANAASFIGTLSVRRVRDLENFGRVTLFPDQLVYPDHEEIRLAVLYILHHIRERGFGLRAIPADQAEGVEQMEAEKYRKGLMATKTNYV